LVKFDTINLKIKMKKLTFAIFLLTCSLAIGQESNFKLENNKLIWQKTYESVNEIPLFSPDNKVLIKVKSFNWALRDYDLIAEYIIETKDSKYRTTVFNMKMTAPDSDPNEIEFFWVKDGKGITKTKSFVSQMEMTDLKLTDFFTIKEKDKW
jgi:hypothetical protein